MCGSESVSRNFSSLCLAISSTSEEKVPSAKKIFRLQIEGDRLGRTEIFHGFGNRNAGFLANPKEIIDRNAARENNSRMRQDIHPLAAELFQGDPLQLNERMEFHIHAVLEHDLMKGRFLGDDRSRL